MRLQPIPLVPAHAPLTRTAHHRRLPGCGRTAHAPCPRCSGARGQTCCASACASVAAAHQLSPAVHLSTPTLFLMGGRLASAEIERSPTRVVCARARAPQGSWPRANLSSSLAGQSPPSAVPAVLAAKSPRPLTQTPNSKRIIVPAALACAGPSRAGRPTRAGATSTCGGCCRRAAPRGCGAFASAEQSAAKPTRRPRGRRRLGLVARRRRGSDSSTTARSFQCNAAGEAGDRGGRRWCPYECGLGLQHEMI